jgi:transcriptional antiterminator NusG
VSETNGNKGAPGDHDVPAGDGGSELRWYVVHTYSGHEARARASLLERAKASGLEELFAEVLIPTESVIEMRKGQRRTTTRKFFPGYMFVKMKLTRESWHLVKGTPKITGFLGGNNPSPVPEREIHAVKRQETEGAAKPKPRVLFEEGETVRVTDGPFSNFSGIVEEVKPEKQKIRVLVSIFGRATPVELDFTQVEKS